MGVPIERYGRIPDGSRIFVGSTMEIFHPAVPAYHRDYIFGEIKDYKNLTFIILTKRPENIDRPMPPNVWLGVSVTGRADLWRVDTLVQHPTTVSFVSFEPLLEPAIPPNGIFAGLKWAIIGRLTGHGKKHDPARADLEPMVAGARIFGVPIFMKQNLADIWPGPLIQEFPKR